MADRRPCDPDALLRAHFTREVEEERRSLHRSDRSVVPRVSVSPGGVVPAATEIAFPLRRVRLQELAAAVLIAACAALAVSFPGAGYPMPSGAAAAERVVSLGREVEGRMTRAVFGFASIRRPSVAPESWIPGRFRGKE